MTTPTSVALEPAAGALPTGHWISAKRQRSRWQEGGPPILLGAKGPRMLRLTALRRRLEL